jgi:hypothetical protein
MDSNTDNSAEILKIIEALSGMADSDFENMDLISDYQDKEYKQPAKQDIDLKIELT